MNLNLKKIEIIKKSNLSPHPEGEWFRKLVGSNNSLVRSDGQMRNYISRLDEAINDLI